MQGGRIVDMKKQEEVNKQAIEKILANSHKRGLTITDIVNEFSKKQDRDISWQTVKRHLNRLAAIQRVDIEKHGNSEVYYLNGKGSFQDQVKLTMNQKLYLDIFRSPWGDPYIRVKESKRQGEQWVDKGAIIISQKAVDEFITKLEALKKNLKEYNN